MRKVLAATLMWAATATGLSAQAPATDVNLRVARAQPGKWEVPDCGLNKGNFMIGSGATYLKSGVDASDEVKKNKLFGDAERVLLEGIQKGQAGASGAWYYLGRAYLQTGDLTGADTALTRAQDLTPSCTKDIQLLRRNTWIVLVNAGIVLHEGQEQRFRGRRSSGRRTSIYRGEPNAYTNMGVLFNSTGPAGQRHRVLPQGGRGGRHRPQVGRDPGPVAVQPGGAAEQPGQVAGGGGGVAAVPQVEAG